MCPTADSSSPSGRFGPTPATKRARVAAVGDAMDRVEYVRGFRWALGEATIAAGHDRPLYVRAELDAALVVGAGHTSADKAGGSRPLAARSARGARGGGGARAGRDVRDELGVRLPGRRNPGRALLAPAGFALLVGPEREDAVKEAIVDGLAAFRLANGSYRLENACLYLIARA